jgi:hypothetical protein
MWIFQDYRIVLKECPFEGSPGSVYLFIIQAGFGGYYL